MTETKEIPITDETFVDHMTRIELDPVMLNLPEGEALCHPALSFTMITADQPRAAGKFIMVIAVAEFDGAHLGVLSPMTATQARNFAASLINGADEIDGGGGLN